MVQNIKIDEIYPNDLNPRHQLGKLERLDQIVVGARGKTGELVGQRIQRGQHQDGGLDALLA